MQKPVILFIATLIFISCSQEQKPKNEEKKMENNKNVDLTRQYFDHFNKHDWAKMAAMYSDSAEFKDPSLGQGIVKQTHAQVAEKYGGLAQMFPDVRDEIVNIYPSGENVVVVEFVSKGKDKDGNGFELPICTIFHFDANGKITKDFTYYDNFEEPK